jgi:hypothetical protein
MRVFAEIHSKRTAAIRALCILGSAAAAFPAIAGSTSAQMQVSVRVVARTILTVEQQPETVEISASDAARGYLDIPDAVALRIRSNAADGYALRFTPVVAPFTRAEITWNSVVLVVGTEPASLAQQYKRGSASGLMRVRLFLAPATVPGSYPWPVQLFAASL